MGVMGTPQYGTFDPTWMLAIFYPLFFGMIVGDIGYGPIMLGTIIWLRMKFKDNDGVQLATAILGPAATMRHRLRLRLRRVLRQPARSEVRRAIMPIWTATVGSGIRCLRVPHRAAVRPYRARDAHHVHVIALGIGVVQVLLGLILGIVNGIGRSTRRTCTRRAGMLAFLVGFVGLILVIVFGASLTATSAPRRPTCSRRRRRWSCSSGFVFAVKGGGVMGVIESVGALANIASYIRIMAVGLAGAIFAEAVNEIAATMGNPILGLLHRDPAPHR